MFFILSKTVYYVFMPLVVIAFFFGYGWWKHKKKNNTVLLYVGLVLSLFFFNDFMANEAMLLWEIAPTPLQELKKTYDVGIVLTGITHYKKSPNDRVYLNHGADRIFHTIMLYKMGKIKKILISGGSGILNRPELKEADDLASIAKLSGIPDSDILIENRSRNTYENAVFSAKILASEFPGKKYLLITSAFHMRRSKGCFKKAGIQADVFSTDFYSSDRSFSFESMAIPNPYAMVIWYKLTREIMGILSYWAVGYL